MIKVKLLEENDEEAYSIFIEGCKNATAQQTLIWRDVIKKTSTDEPFYFILENNGKIAGVLPTFIYRCDLGNIMVSIPQAGGYGGIAYNEDILNLKKIFKYLLDEMIIKAKEQGCILATISTNPFLNDFKYYKEMFEPNFRLENFIQYIDLNQVINYDRNIKRNIRKAEQHNFEVIHNIEEKDLLFWYEIHKKRLYELGGLPIPYELFYYTYKYMIPANKAKFILLKYNDKIISGCLYLFHKNIMDVFMLSVDSKYMDLHPNSYLTKVSIELAKEIGCKYYNWQSSISKNSGVYQYKARWGSIEGFHYYLTKVLEDITSFKKTDIEIIKEKYKWHYVMPYSQFESKDKIDVQI